MRTTYNLSQSTDVSASDVTQTPLAETTADEFINLEIDKFKIRNELIANILQLDEQHLSGELQRDFGQDQSIMMCLHKPMSSQVKTYHTHQSPVLI